MQQGNTLEKLPLGGDKPRAALDAARGSLNNIILGKDAEISLALACLLARGHLLIEDLPGLGKTMRGFRTSPSESPSRLQGRSVSPSWAPRCGTPMRRLRLHCSRRWPAGWVSTSGAARRNPRDTTPQEPPPWSWPGLRSDSPVSSTRTLQLHSKSTCV